VLFVAGGTDGTGPPREAFADLARLGWRGKERIWVSGALGLVASHRTTRRPARKAVHLRPPVPAAPRAARALVRCLDEPGPPGRWRWSQAIAGRTRRVSRELAVGDRYAGRLARSADERPGFRYSPGDRGISLGREPWLGRGLQAWPPAARSRTVPVGGGGSVSFAVGTAISLLGYRVGRDQARAARSRQPRGCPDDGCLF